MRWSTILQVTMLVASIAAAWQGWAELSAVYSTGLMLSIIVKESK